MLRRRLLALCATAMGLAPAVADAQLDVLADQPAQHALHLGHSQFVNLIVPVRLAKSVVGADVIPPLRKRPPLLHVSLRGVKTSTPEMELVLHV